MKSVAFTLIAISQLKEWKKRDKKIYSRTDQLINSIQETPFMESANQNP